LLDCRQLHVFIPLTCVTSIRGDVAGTIYIHENTIPAK
jgi:hypothetical protein